MKAIYTWLNLLTLSLATTLRLTIPPSSLLPNPAILPASTHATLTTAGTRVSVPVRAGQADFLFRVPGHVSGPDGQYILTIDTKDYVFRSYRVDVDNGKVGGVWEVTRGVPWDRPSPGSGISLGGGADAGADADAVLEVGVLGRRAFFEQRATCMSSPPSLSLDQVLMQIVSPLSLFQNPMILLAVAALGLTFGMPKLMENSAFPFPPLSIAIRFCSLRVLTESSGPGNARGIRKTVPFGSHLGLG